MDYIEHKESIEVPKNVGLKGFLLAIENILKLPRVQDINIDARGKVHYRYFLREGEQGSPLAIDFDGISPYAIIRNGTVMELEMRSSAAGPELARLFELASMDHVFPIAWVAGANTLFWKWFESSCQFNKKNKEELFGYPFLTEPRHVGEETLILCAGYGRGGALIDTQRSYKLTIPKVP